MKIDKSDGIGAGKEKNSYVVSLFLDYLRVHRLRMKIIEASNEKEALMGLLEVAYRKIPYMDEIREKYKKLPMSKFKRYIQYSRGIQFKVIKLV